MDLESKRISTRVKLPFIPIKGDLLVRQPKTQHGDRLVACGTGWLLAELGVPEEVLASTNAPAEAVRKHKPNAPVMNFFNGLAELNDKGRLKEMFQQMLSVISANRTTLNNAFGYYKVTAVETKIRAVLADYAKVDAPKVERPATRR